MTHDNTHGTAGDMKGRSLVETPLPALRNGVRSGSAVGRCARRVHDLIGRQNEVERVAEVWAGALGERADALSPVAPRPAACPSRSRFIPPYPAFARGVACNRRERQRQVHLRQAAV